MSKKKKTGAQYGMMSYSNVISIKVCTGKQS